MAQQVALVTGFEPYGGRGVNPSAAVAKRVDGIATGRPCRPGGLTCHHALRIIRA